MTLIGPGRPLEERFGHAVLHEAQPHREPRGRVLVGRVPTHPVRDVRVDEALVRIGAGAGRHAAIVGSAVDTVGWGR